MDFSYNILIQAEETSDFDLGLVEWSEDESEAINVILSVKNTTQDKLAYTVSNVLNAI